MVFSQNLLYACTMKTIPAIETNRPTKKYRERKQECSLTRAKSPNRISSPPGFGKVLWPVRDN
jgi:hypothetical protein